MTTIYHLCKDGKQKPGHREDCLSCNPAKRASRVDAIVMEQTARIMELKATIDALQKRINELEAQVNEAKEKAAQS